MLKYVILAVVLLIVAGAVLDLDSGGGITEQVCDAEKPCALGSECYDFADLGPRCVKGDPCDYIECPGSCFIAESCPMQVICVPE